MLKLLVETGSESHTSNSASLQVKFKSGPHSGKMLFQVPEYQQTAKWTMVQNGRWVQTVYELPDFTEIEVIGRGRTGNRGAIKHHTHHIYRLEPTAEVLDTLIDVGLRDCTLKGRLVLIQDVLAAKEKNLTASQQEDF